MTRFLDLKRVRKPLPPRRSAQRVWNAIRQQRRFTVSEIAAITELTEKAVLRIMRPWRCTAIVRQQTDGFRLARDLGPKPPFSVGQVAGLVDRTTGEVLPFNDTPRAPRLRPARILRRALIPRPAKKRGRPKGKSAPIVLTAAQQHARLLARRAANNAYARRNRDKINARRRVRRRERKAQQAST